jgi:hypothetical protein
LRPDAGKNLWIPNQTVTAFLSSLLVYYQCLS